INMGKIRILAENVANKIAAGEVVERPSSVVKELVENSLDADSTEIIVEVKNGGKELIRVIDNGTGMSYDDAILSISRHATSKIQSIKDLESITTFGFRGEALPSIASVSQFELITKQVNSIEGTRIRVEGGVTRDVEYIGCSQGTRVTVSNLFYNVPARRKFLKSNATELDHIIKYITWAGLAYPQVAFKLISNDRVIIDARKCNSVMERIYTLFGKDFSDNVVNLDMDLENIGINAFIGKPGFTKTTRDYQLFFLNLRPIRSNLLSAAVSNAFKSILPKGRYPVAIVFLKINPSLVDINVHPAKLEVRFRDERTVYSEVIRCLTIAMQDQKYIPEINVSVEDIPLPAETEPKLHEPIEKLSKPLNPRKSEVERSISRFIDRQEKMVLQTPARPYERLEKFKHFVKPSEEFQKREFVKTESSIDIENIQLKARIFNTYIIAEFSDEVLFIDQHIADERVIYEKLRKDIEQKSVPSQGLLLPITVELSPSQALVSETAIDMLSNMGFDIEPFGGNTIIVRAIPSVVKRGDIKQMIIDLIERTADSYDKLDKLELQNELLITTACHSSIQAGDNISDTEALNLIRELFRSEQPFLCPHGRPIIVRMKRSELDEKFQRK
ncbi:MAG: DNA mismatch repair endonuclease MutL, partial [bacterium]